VPLDPRSMSHSVIQTVFPTSIYFKPLEQTSKLRRELINQCNLVRESDEAGQEWSAENYRHGYTSYGSITDLHARYPHFEELRKKLDRHVKSFARYLEMDLQGGALSMVSSWVNIMPANTAHSLHLHPLSVISGTYYVSVPKGASSIKFEDPRLSKFMASPPKLEGAKAKNQPFIKVSPSNGMVGLWESWLRHEVPPNPSDEDRISISFNYDWR
jgi:uncharacterized protein (TIGR02466 family)